MYQKEELQLKPETVTFIMGFISFPYGIKPVFGYLIDWLNSKVSKIKHIIFVSNSIR